jgi:hypothetical protein
MQEAGETKEDTGGKVNKLTSDLCTSPLILHCLNVDF